MFERLATMYQTAVAVVTSQYTKGTAIVAGGGIIDWFPAQLGKYGGMVIAAMGVYVLGKAIVAIVKKP
jgi:hypothetical protein